jgi:hypothetical protein
MESASKLSNEALFTLLSLLNSRKYSPSHVERNTQLHADNPIEVIAKIKQRTSEIVGRDFEGRQSVRHTNLKSSAILSKNANSNRQSPHFLNNTLSKLDGLLTSQT